MALKVTAEWADVPEIVKLTFKGVVHVLKAHSDCIKEMEHILPAKANKADVSQQIAQKANVFDIKKTMAEVAASIESRVTYEDHRAALADKLSKGEISFYLQDKVSVADFKQFVSGNGRFERERQNDFLEDEI
jgi:hypothetical protein